jgi:hypothetical protein
LYCDTSDQVSLFFKLCETLGGQIHEYGFASSVEANLRHPASQKKVVPDHGSQDNQYLIDTSSGFASVVYDRDFRRSKVQ